jgi:hypothetical protein
VTQTAKGYTECLLGVSRPERAEENAEALRVQSRPKPSSTDLHRLVSAVIYMKSLTGKPLSPARQRFRVRARSRWTPPARVIRWWCLRRVPRRYRALLGDLKHRQYVRVPVLDVSPYGLFGGVGVALFDCVQNLDVVIHVMLPGCSAVVAL